MPGRFPLTPVALTGDAFCADAYCGDPTTVIPITVIRKCWYQRYPGGTSRAKVYGCVVDPNGDMYVAQYFGSGVLPAIYKISNDVTQVWGKLYSLDPALVSTRPELLWEELFSTQRRLRLHRLFSLAMESHWSALLCGLPHSYL
jgi:hypothetical protein